MQLNLRAERLLASLSGIPVADAQPDELRRLAYGQDDRPLLVSGDDTTPERINP